MKKKIVSIFVCMLLIIIVLPNTSGKMEIANEKYEEINSSELLSDGQPDLIIYDRMNGRIGDDVYSTPPYGQHSDNVWFLPFLPWVSCMRLELQNDGPADMDCTIEIIWQSGTHWAGLFYPSEDRSIDFIGVDNAPELVNIHSAGDSVFLMFFCLCIPHRTTWCDVMIHAETTDGYHDNVHLTNWGPM